MSKKNFSFVRKTFSLLLVLLLTGSLTGYAQNGYVLSGFRDVQQSSYLNPAFVSGARVVVGIPFLSNLSEGLMISGGGLSQYLDFHADSVTFNLDKVIQNGKQKNDITEFFDQDVLFSGFKAGKVFITLGVRQHIYLQTVVDNDALRLLWNEDMGYSDISMDLSHTNVSEYHIMDYHLGASVPVGKNIRVGARIHFLQALSDITTDNNGLRIHAKKMKNQDEYELHAYTDFRINTAGLPDTSDFSPADYFMNFDNLGFSVDLGVDAQVTKRLYLNASILNWGSIHFRGDTKSYYTTKDSVYLNSADVDINDDNVFDHLGDTLQKLFAIQNDTRDFSMKLPFRFTIGAEYYTGDFRNDFSLMFSGRSFSHYFEPAVSVAYTRFVSPHFSVKANYTWIKDAPVNFGLAMAVNFSPFQFYVYSDNVPGIFRWDSQNYVQAGLGLNIRLAPRNTRKNPNNPQAIRNLRPDIIMAEPAKK